MILMSQDAVAFNGFFATVSTDINMPPSDIGATAYLSAVFQDGTPDSAFSGFSGFVTVDSSGTPSETTLNAPSPSVVFATNCITLTFVTGTLAANQTSINGACVVLP